MMDQTSWCVENPVAASRSNDGSALPQGLAFGITLTDSAIDVIEK